MRLQAAEPPGWAAVWEPPDRGLGRALYRTQLPVIVSQASDWAGVFPPDGLPRGMIKQNLITRSLARVTCLLHPLPHARL